MLINPNEDFIKEFRGNDFNGWTALSQMGRLFYLKELGGKWIEVINPLEQGNSVAVPRKQKVESGIVKVETPQQIQKRKKAESEKKIWGDAKIDPDLKVLDD